MTATFPPEEQSAAALAGNEASTTDKGQGRLEKRTLRTTTVLTKQQDWAGLQQGFELVRKRTVNGVKTVETVQGITGLDPERANAQRLLDLTREHWQIENGLHYSRIRKGGWRRR